VKDLPTEFTWRGRTPDIVGPPRDQVACGSCWAFATAEVMESYIARAKNVSHRDISVNQIMDCTWDNNNNGCQGGEVDLAYSSMMARNLAVAWESDYPYLGVSGYCNQDPGHYKSAGHISACWHIGKKGEGSTRNLIKQALMHHGPLAIGINVVESMLLYSGGVFEDKTCTGAIDDLVHAVVLTGWKVIDGKEAWEVKNSWSTYWGWDGYVYIQSENQEWNCGVTTDVVAVELAK
jgi:C1A family cysteine protease